LSAVYASLLLLLIAIPAYARQIWAVWELDLGSHAPPTQFILTVTSPTGTPVPPAMTVPGKTCTQPDIPATSYCAPIGCPPTGTYVFIVQAQYDDGLSDPSNAFTCAIPSPSSICDCTSGSPAPTAPAPPVTIPSSPIVSQPPPDAPPGMISEPPAGMNAEAPPLPQQNADGLNLQSLGDYPTAPTSPEIPGSLIKRRCSNPTAPPWKEVACNP